MKTYISLQRSSKNINDFLRGSSIKAYCLAWGTYHESTSHWKSDHYIPLEIKINDTNLDLQLHNVDHVLVFVKAACKAWLGLLTRK
jgi:hypothetical protein